MRIILLLVLMMIVSIESFGRNSFAHISKDITEDGRPIVCFLAMIDRHVEYRIDATSDGYTWTQIGTIPANDWIFATACILVADLNLTWYRLVRVPPLETN